MRILNTSRLCGHGNVRGRTLALDILEAGLAACDPYLNTRRMLRLDGSRLIVGHPDFEPSGDPQRGEASYDLTAIRRVLVVGGWKRGNDGNPVYLANAELYDPATGVWSATGSLSNARSGHIATLLPVGRVLVAGEFLCVSQISCAAQYRGNKVMPERVRGNLAIHFWVKKLNNAVTNDSSPRSGSHWFNLFAGAFVMAGKNRKGTELSSRISIKCRSYPQVILNRLNRPGCKAYDGLFVALPDNNCKLLVPVHIAASKFAGLVDTEATIGKCQ